MSGPESLVLSLCYKPVPGVTLPGAASTIDLVLDAPSRGPVNIVGSLRNVILPTVS